ncbi:MAG: type VI secretion system baseplate subunit TssF [Gammaproteobacteria bacterium HGW-Gammaproteobacteria-8]|nr:MAG: type VI secretion system baseplate subunit TssF [Gammaproteobacteria bacterium HGW-Gammaproteobacteria-8]
MDPGFLRFYNTELQHLRDMGAEFAREYPKIAGRIGLDEFECADPYVERLLEGFAFLAARLQLKIDKEYDRFTQHLFEIVFPHFLAPIPSMAVVRFQPDMNEGSLCDGFVIERDTPLRGRIGRGEQTACEFRTRQEVVLWPIVVESAQYLPTRGDVSALGIRPPEGTRSGLRLRLKATGGFSFDEIPVDMLTLYLNGAGEQVASLMEHFHAGSLGFFVRGRGEGDAEPRLRFIPADAIEMPGLVSEEAVLPCGYRSFQGYRLLQEYFAFPERFNFVRISGLAGIARDLSAQQLELIFTFDRQADNLENSLDAENIVLNCAPAVNLFPRQCDRIHVTERDPELHVIPDRTRPMDFEIHTIESVQGFRTGVHEGDVFKPFFWSHDRVAARGHSAFYTQRREPRRLSSRQQRDGARSSYVGSEVFLTLVDGHHAPYPESIRQLAVTALCSNRDLPLHMPVGEYNDFSLLSSAPVTGVECLKGPTRPRARFTPGDTRWRLISHLSLNYLSLLNDRNGNGAASLREMLELYADLSDSAIRRQVEGVSSIEAESIIRRLPMAGPLTAGRGIGIRLTLDESAFEGLGIFLLGRILAEFFARHASINSFTETRVVSTQRGEIVRWPMTIGRRATL